MTKIIAELCQNHNGDMSILKEMVHAAKESGADFAKIQSLLSSDLTHRSRFDLGEEENGITKVIKRPFKNEYERLKKLDLDDKQHFEFSDYCKKYKIKPMTTIFNRSRLKFLETLGFETIKVSSFDCSSHKMISELSQSKFKNILVSTGCTYDDEIKKTTKLLKNKSLTILHCVSIYPTPISESHLNRINFLKKINSSVGLSEHSNYDRDHLKISIVSLSYDIDFIERHFTILPKNETKDGIVSLNEKELKELVDISKLSKKDLAEYISKNITINDLNELGGFATRELSHTELLNRDYYRGRFASKDSQGKIIYNWEDHDIN